MENREILVENPQQFDKIHFVFNNESMMSTPDRATNGDPWRDGIRVQLQSDGQPMFQYRSIDAEEYITIREMRVPAFIFLEEKIDTKKLYNDSFKAWQENLKYIRENQNLWPNKEYKWLFEYENTEFWNFNLLFSGTRLSVQANDPDTTWNRKDFGYMYEIDDDVSNSQLKREDIIFSGHFDNLNFARAKGSDYLVSTIEDNVHPIKKKTNISYSFAIMRDLETGLVPKLERFAKPGIVNRLILVKASVAGRPKVGFKDVISKVTLSTTNETYHYLDWKKLFSEEHIYIFESTREPFCQITLSEGINFINSIKNVKDLFTKQHTVRVKIDYSVGKDTFAFSKSEYECILDQTKLELQNRWTHIRNHHGHIKLKNIRKIDYRKRVQIKDRYEYRLEDTITYTNLDSILKINFLPKNYDFKWPTGLIKARKIGERYTNYFKNIKAWFAEYSERNDKFSHNDQLILLDDDTNPDSEKKAAIKYSNYYNGQYGNHMQIKLDPIILDTKYAIQIRSYFSRHGVLIKRLSLLDYLRERYRYEVLVINWLKLFKFRFYQSIPSADKIDRSKICFDIRELYHLSVLVPLSPLDVYYKSSTRTEDPGLFKGSSGDVLWAGKKFVDIKDRFFYSYYLQFPFFVAGEYLSYNYVISYHSFMNKIFGASDANYWQHWELKVPKSGRIPDQYLSIDYNPNKNKVPNDPRGKSFSYLFWPNGTFYESSVDPLSYRQDIANFWDAEDYVKHISYESKNEFVMNISVIPNNKVNKRIGEIATSAWKKFTPKQFTQYAQSILNSNADTQSTQLLGRIYMNDVEESFSTVLDKTVETYGVFTLEPLDTTTSYTANGNKPTQVEMKLYGRYILLTGINKTQGMRYLEFYFFNRNGRVIEQLVPDKKPALFERIEFDIHLSKSNRTMSGFTLMRPLQQVKLILDDEGDPNKPVNPIEVEINSNEFFDKLLNMTTNGELYAHLERVIFPLAIHDTSKAKLLKNSMVYVKSSLDVSKNDNIYPLYINGVGKNYFGSMNMERLLGGKSKLQSKVSKTSKEVFIAPFRTSTANSLMLADSPSTNELQPGSGTAYQFPVYRRIREFRKFTVSLVHEDDTLVQFEDKVGKEKVAGIEVELSLVLYPFTPHVTAASSNVKSKGKTITGGTSAAAFSQLEREYKRPRII